MSSEVTRTCKWTCDRCGNTTTGGWLGVDYDYPAGWIHITGGGTGVDLCPVCVLDLGTWIRDGRVIDRTHEPSGT